jgi:hypothetical protein
LAFITQIIQIKYGKERERFGKWSLMAKKILEPGQARDEVLAAQKAFIDWLIDDPDMTQLF